MRARGVEFKWFGAPEPVAFTSRYEHWRYANPRTPAADRQGCWRALSTCACH